MSTTIPAAAPPAAPVASSPEADAMVAVSKTLAELVAFAQANPELMAYLQQHFGTALASAAHTTAGSFLGAVIGWAFAHFGISADPSLTVTLCGGGVIAGSLIWNGALAMIRNLKSK